MSTRFKMMEGYHEDPRKHLGMIADNMRILLEEEIEPEVRGEGRNFFDIVRDQLARYRGRIAKLENQIVNEHFN